MTTEGFRPTIDQLTPADRYESMKGYFAYFLHGEMRANSGIWVVSADLGFGMFDKIQRDFPDRFLNVGAAEQAAVGIACGLALKGKIPFVYSITNFALYRPYEWLRNYVDYESIPIKLVGAGRDKEYAEDGYTHQSEDARAVLANFPNIIQYWPEDKAQVEAMVKEMIGNGKPCFLSLRRKL